MDDFSLKKFFTPRLASVSVIVLILFSMISWSIRDAFNGRNPDVVATFDGGMITTRQLDLMSSRLKERYSKHPSVPISDDQIKRAALHTLINTELMKLHSTSLGFIISDDQIIEKVLKKDKQLLDKNGDLNAEFVKRVLGANGLSEKEYFDRIRSEILFDGLQSVIHGAAVAQDTVVKRMIISRSELRTYDLIEISDKNLNIQVTQPSKEDILSFYQSHKKEFSIPETMNVRYMNIGDTFFNIRISDEDVKNYYDTRYRDMDRRVTFTILRFNEHAEATKAISAVKKFQNRLSEVGKSLGYKSSDIIISDVKISELDQKLVDIVSRLPLQKISDIFEIDGKFAVLQVIKVESLEKYTGDEKRKIFASIKNELLKRRKCTLAAQIESKIYNLINVERKSASDIAKIWDINVHTSSVHNGDRMYKANLDAGNTFVLKDDDGCMFSIVSVEEKIPERVLELSSVESKIIKTILLQKKRDRLQEIATSLANQIREIGSDEDSVQRIVSSKNVVIRRDLSMKRSDIDATGYPDVVSGIFSENIGGVVGPFRDRRDVQIETFLIGIVRKITDIDPQNKVVLDNLDIAKRDIEKQKVYDLDELYMKYLYGKYNVKTFL